MYVSFGEGKSSSGHCLCSGGGCHHLWAPLSAQRAARSQHLRPLLEILLHLLQLPCQGGVQSATCAPARAPASLPVTVTLCLKTEADLGSTWSLLGPVVCLSFPSHCWPRRPQGQRQVQREQPYADFFTSSHNCMRLSACTKSLILVTRCSPASLVKLPVMLPDFTPTPSPPG